MKKEGRPVLDGNVSETNTPVWLVKPVETPSLARRALPFSWETLGDPTNF